jgi:hypothetical protein
MYKLLFSNGDFMTRSNEVETAYRRVNPDDRDDDGIANERDANPMIYDGISGCRNHPKFPHHAARQFGIISVRLQIIFKLKGSWYEASGH